MDDTPEVFVPAASIEDAAQETEDSSGYDAGETLMDKIKTMTEAMASMTEKTEKAMESFVSSETATGSDASPMVSSDPVDEIAVTLPEDKWFTPLTHSEYSKLLRDKGVRVISESEETSFDSILRSKTDSSGYSAVTVLNSRVLRRASSQSRYSLDTPNSRIAIIGRAREYRHARQSDMSHFYADAGRNQAILNVGTFRKAGLFGFLPDAAVLPLIVRNTDTMSKALANEKVAKATEATTDKYTLIRYMWSLYSGEYFAKARPADVSDELLATRRVRGSTWVDPNLNDKLLNIDNLGTELFSVRYRDVSGSARYVYVEGEESSTLSEEDPSKSEEHSTAPVSDVAESNRYLRPNGEYYVSRDISVAGSKKKIKDVDMVRKARDSRINVLLKGRPGTGKTALTEAALENLQVVECDASTESADFLGSYVPTGVDSFEWQDGPLIVAAKNGWPLLVDEIALCDTRELAVLYSAMDGRKKITVTSNPEIGEVDIEDGFYVIGACNPDVPGAVMSDALLSRFPIQLEVTTDYGMMSKLGVDDEIITVARNLAKQEANKEIMRAPQTRELLDFMRVKNVFGLHAAVASFVATADSIDMDTYIAVTSAAFGIKAAPIKI